MGNIIKFEKLFYKGSDIMTNIDKKRMLEIEGITSNILKEVDFSISPYVDIVSLVKKDKFIVKPTEMDIETTGCLLVNEDKKSPVRLITVNTFFKNPENESDVIFKKSRFITAHEYGHFILHRESGKPIYAHRDTYHRTEPKELEADFFARSILMPLKQFELYFNLLNEMGNNDRAFTIEMLSKLFKVTKNKINKRVEDLLVLSNNTNYGS